MIDMHLHALPGVDDGAKTTEDAVAMLLQECELGFTAVILTPHYRYHGHHARTREELNAAAEKIRREVQKTVPDFSLCLGEEIKYFSDMTEALKSGKALTMADSSYCLVEFDPGDTWTTIYQAVRKLRMNQYLPIVAHIERYEALRKEGRLTELKALGASLQMNYDSLEGGIFNANTRWCREQVLEEKIDFLGTDAHRPEGSRTPDVHKALKWLKQKCPPELAKRMTEDNPRKVLEAGKAKLKEKQHETA